MESKKLLILGTGSIGSRYFNILKNNNEFIVKTFDNRKNSKSNFESFKDIQSWKAKSALICLPTHLHSTYVIKLILIGFKYILVEKPISNNLKNFKKIKRLAKEKNVKVFVVTNMRFHPGIVYLKKNINLVGNISFARSYFKNNLKNMYNKKLKGHYSNFHNLGGGILYDGCHEVDYLKYLFGPIIKSTSVAFSENNSTATDVFHSIITHKNKIISSINSDFLTKSKKRGCEIYGEKGTLAWTSYGKPGKERVVVNFLSKNKKEKKIFSCKNYNINQMYERQIYEFTLMKKRRKYNMSNLGDSLNTLNILLKSKLYGIKKIKKIS